MLRARARASAALEDHGNGAPSRLEAYLIT